MEYIKVKSFIEEVNQELKVLVGHKPVLEGGIMKLFADVANQVINRYPEYNLEVHDYKIAIFCPAFNEDVCFTTLNYTYKPDKRTLSGHSNQLSSISVVLDRDIPDDFDLIDLPQYLEYEVSKERYNRLLKRQMELIKELNRNAGFMYDCCHTMYMEAYSSEKKCEAFKCKDAIQDLKKELKF